MPRLGQTVNQHRGNGRPRKRPSFKERLAEQLRPDEFDVGSALPGDEESVRGATMADAAKLISGVKYLLKGWIPYGMVTGVVAEPGVYRIADRTQRKPEPASSWSRSTW